MAANTKVANYVTVTGSGAEAFLPLSRTGVHTKIEKQLTELLISAKAAKLAVDKAEEDYDKAMDALMMELRTNSLNGVKTTDPAVLEKFPGLEKFLEYAEIESTTNIADPKAYAELVTEEEFFASIKVNLTEAKKFVLPKNHHLFLTKGEPKISRTIKGK